MVTARLTAPRWALFAQVSTSAAGMVIRPNHHRRARASAGNLPGAGKRPACATAGALLPWAHDGLRTVLTARVLIAAGGAVRAGQRGPGWCRCLRSRLPSAPRVLDVRLTAERGQHLGAAQRVALPVALDPRMTRYGTGRPAEQVAEPCGNDYRPTLPTAYSAWAQVKPSPYDEVSWLSSSARLNPEPSLM